MTLMQERAIERIKNMPDEEIASLLNLMDKANNQRNEELEARRKTFRELNSMLKKDSTTDYDAELAAYREEKYGV